MKSAERIIIIGGGLSGLTLAWLLLKKGLEATILEASPRLGGRIQTITGALGTPLEIGATWFSDLHVNLLELIGDLGLIKYPQFSEGISLFQTKSFEPPQKFYVPAADQPSYRIAGGTQLLIEKLAQQLNSDQVHLNKKVTGIYEIADGLKINTADGNIYGADCAIICLSPQVSATIDFVPDLPEVVSEILPAVQTWMAGSVKFTLEYSKPFWRQAGYSGMLYSHAGIVMEMYDHTNLEEDKFGFTGFLNSAAAGYSQEVRRELVLKQLSELFGPEILQPATYLDKAWTDEFILNGHSAIGRPHQNNGHPALHSPYLGGKLYFCGTETAKIHSGYMEGAVIAARSIAYRLLQ
ncbi:NAD(P)/FAD-dependent oxidoreductase [Mucilaginibacter sp. cycad4]|nr:NAD(P)/FAD-dependent oxidoreductase [Mucilaginibacter gossypii]WPV02025.1 NAD(P)/FAD-dependent oxidoreductase [Mucilaginibacter gossypii]